MTNEREKITHPSYGMISITRTHGNSGKLFGSELEIDHFITLAIQHGSMERDLTNDWFYADHRKPIIEVKMSPLQFSEMITNMNMGDGVPCTIVYENGKDVPQETNPITKKDTTHRQFKQRMTEFAKTLVEQRDRAKKLMEKKTLSKEDQREFLFYLEWLTQEISGNIPFFMECFQETADRVVSEAKAEVEAAIMHKVTTLGLAELQNQNKLLTDGK